MSGLGNVIWVLSKKGSSGPDGAPQYRNFVDEDGLQWRKGIRDEFIILDVAITTDGFNGIENEDWKNVDSTVIIKLPDPDVIFDQRQGLNIIDSVNNEIVTIGGFPMANLHQGSSMDTRYDLDTTGITPLNDWTIIVLY
jgi:hypothetical protein